MTRRIILVDIGAGLTLRGVLPSVALFADYTASLVASGGQAPYSYSLAAGALPAGLALDAATGIISGTAGVAGQSVFTVRVTDLSGAHVDRQFAITVIAEPLSLSGAAPAWTVGTPYSYTYSAAHGVPPYSWSLAAGALPAGLALNAATGEISGTPTAGNAPAWTVRVTDSAGASIDLRDNATLQLLGDFADATVGTAYSSDLLINGGDAPYSNPRVTVGALPAGLALSIVGDKLRLSGTPTAAATSSFTAAVDSADGQTAASVQSVTVGAASAGYNALVASYAPDNWWRLDQTTGTAATDSGSQPFDGTLTGGSTFASSGVSVPAPTGYAGLGRGVDFAAAGVDDVRFVSGGADRPAFAQPPLSYGSWTIVLVVAGSAGASQYLASRVNSAAIIYNFVADTVEFFALGYSGDDLRPGSQIPLDSSDATTPHKIVYRYDGATNSFTGWKDGTQVFAVTRHTAVQGSFNLFIGSDSATNRSNCKTWDFQGYNRALTDSEIADMWAARNNA